MNYKITSETINIERETGIKIKYFVNLSSGPTNEVSLIMRSVFGLSIMPQAKPIIMHATYNTAINQFTKPSRRIGTFFVTDSDDNMRDIKIRNICEMTNSYKIAEIQFQLEESKSDVIMNEGMTVRVGSEHLTYEDREMYAITNLKSLENTKDLNIYQISRSTHNSIAALTCIANRRKIPFNVTYIKAENKPSWLLCKMEDLTKFGNNKNGENKVVLLKQGDKHWNYKTGYTNFLPTEKGLIRITDYNSRKQRNKQTNGKTRIADFFKNMVSIIIRYITRFIENIIKKYNPRSEERKKKKGSDKNKETKHNKKKKK